jgi:hypothetical protein
MITPLLAGALTYLAYIVPPELREWLVALHFVKWPPHTLELIDRVDDQRSYDAMRKDFDTWNPSLLPPQLGEAHAKFRRTIDSFHESKEFGQLSGASRLSGAVRLGTDVVEENALADAIAIPSPQPALEAMRLIINRYGAARGWPAPSAHAYHWTIAITSVQPSAATIANNERNDALEPYLLIASSTATAPSPPSPGPISSPPPCPRRGCRSIPARASRAST